MAIDRTFRDHADLQGLSGDAIIELFILDLLPLDPLIDPGARYIRFCNWSQTGGAAVFYDEQEYIALPVSASGFEVRSEGVPPNPSMNVGNIGLEWTGLINTWDDLVGAKVTRRRTLRRHLDDGSAPDPSGHWPDEVWSIEQKESETKLSVAFRLGTPFDLDGVLLPRRRALRYTCVWRYKGPECGYTGPLPTCGLSLTDCRSHFPNVDLPWGGFPGLTTQ